MKIYNKIVIDIATDRIVAEDSFEYFGEVAYCDSGGSTSVKYPAPTEQELALQQMQLDLLTQQGEEAELMRPYILQSMGLKDVGGELVQMSEEEYIAGLSELEQGQYDITKQQQERLAMAYAGELPVSPSLEKSLGQQETQLSEALSQRLGPDWQTTTAGQQAMGELKERSELLREETRRGEISSGSGALLSNLGQLQSAGALKSYGATTFPGRTGGLFAGAGQAMVPYQTQRQGMFSADMYSAQSRAASQAGLMSGIGGLFGAGIGAYGLYKGLTY